MDATLARDLHAVVGRAVRDRRYRFAPVLPLLLLLGGCGADTEVAVGTLEWDRIELVAEQSEPIVEVLRREGERVAAGELLLRLDPRRSEAHLAQARAARGEAAARLAELERGPRAERIAEARARLRGAEDELTIRTRELDRLEELLKRKLASPEAVDSARRFAESARAERDRARAALAELEAGATREELDQARSALAQAEATVQARELDLERLAVRAPVAGRLDDLPFKLGEQPPVGQVVALMLAGDRPYARVYVPEPVRVHVMPGTRAQVSVDGLDEPLEGRVRKVQADPAFTPFFALTEHDRGRLAYLAEIALPEASPDLPAGVPLEARFLGPGRSEPLAAEGKERVRE